MLSSFCFHYFNVQLIKFHVRTSFTSTVLEISLTYKVKLLFTSFLRWMTQYETAKKKFQEGDQVQLLADRYLLNFNREKQLNI